MPYLATFFDTPGRCSPAEIASQTEDLRSTTCASAILNGVPAAAFVLNEQRQIVMANRAGVALTDNLRGPGSVDGLRLGEALSCINVPSGPGGCGTTPRCRYCGAGQANKAFGEAPGEYSGEFRLRSVNENGESAQTFQFHLSPMTLRGSTLRICSLTDITAARGREVTDRIFFHDVLNTAQAVQGAAGLIPGLDDREILDDLARIVSTSAGALVAEIETQRDLRRAEEGHLTVALEPVPVSATVAEIVSLYRQSRFAAGRQIEMLPTSAEDSVMTSRVHLSRSVGNLLKNALEASAAGECVSVRVIADGDQVRIDVHNPAVMPEAVQAQVFQRFFSTKASSGRGLGTYSVKLLVTRALRGRVTFTSVPGCGTTFSILLPRGNPPAPPGSRARVHGAEAGETRLLVACSNA